MKYREKSEVTNNYVHLQ